MIKNIIRGCDMISASWF